MNLKPIKPNYARKIAVANHKQKNQTKQVINLDEIKKEIKTQIYKELYTTLKHEINTSLKLELYNMLKQDLILNGQNNANAQNYAPIKDSSNELLLQEIRAELALFNRLHQSAPAPAPTPAPAEQQKSSENPLDFNTEFSKSPFGAFLNNGKDEKIQQIEEELKETDLDKNDSELSDEVLNKTFDVFGNKVLSFCCDRVYKLEMSNDKPEKKAEKVFEFLNFDAVKNGHCKPLDIYAVIDMKISDELKAKLIENEMLTEEEITRFNSRFPEEETENKGETK